MKNKSFLYNKLVLTIISLTLYTLITISESVLTYNSLAYTIVLQIGILSVPLLVYICVESILKNDNKQNCIWLITLAIYSFIATILSYLVIYTDVYPIHKNTYYASFSMDLFLISLSTYFIKQKNKYSFIAILPLLVHILSIFKFTYNNFYCFPFLTKYGIFSFILFISTILGFILSKKVIKRKAIKDKQDVELYTQMYTQKISTFISLIIVVSLFLINLLLRHYNIPFIDYQNKEQTIFYDYSLLSYIFIFLYNGQDSKLLSCNENKTQERNDLETNTDLIVNNNNDNNDNNLNTFNKTKNKKKNIIITKTLLLSYYPLHILILYALSFII